MCVDIEIIQNGIVEPIETFDVMAISTNTSTSGSILIFDTDSKLTHKGSVGHINSFTVLSKMYTHGQQTLVACQRGAWAYFDIPLNKAHPL